MTTVLIVDDEQDMRNLIEVMLVKSNFQAITAGNGAEAFAQLSNQSVDLILLDVMMPGEDGFQVCKKIRETSSVPIIFLTARDANEDKVKGLTIGGDDYIIKPFTVSELVARINAVLRRTGAITLEVEQKFLVRGLIKLDEVSRKVLVNDVHVPLTLKEFELLHLFMQNPDNVYSREQLLERIWDIDYAGGTRTVDTHIKTLRLKLGKPAKEVSDYIQTVWGIGYRFEKCK
ncbi:response regulator transcription factor [Lysinibacillus sp. 54212]|uniref:response regulator transcription factor n=1 Tax=Lysinibacillus sp. 54212 TaxID=3119829 RepID=UPI002FC94EEC